LSVFAIIGERLRFSTKARTVPQHAMYPGLLKRAPSTGAHAFQSSCFNHDTKTMPSGPYFFQFYRCFLYLIDGSNKQPILVEKLVREISLHYNVSCVCRVSIQAFIFGMTIEFWKKLHDTIRKSCPKAILVYRGRILGRIQTKVLRDFLLAIHSHLYSFALRFQFLQTHATSLRFLQFAYCTR
jgi:hypothetical protein